MSKRKNMMKKRRAARRNEARRLANLAAEQALHASEAERLHQEAVERNQAIWSKNRFIGARCRGSVYQISRDGVTWSRILKAQLAKEILEAHVAVLSGDRSTWLSADALLLFFERLSEYSPYKYPPRDHEALRTFFTTEKLRAAA